MGFLALFISLPTRQTAGRMRIWRALRALGCATLRDGVFLLPETPAHEQALARVAADVRETRGVADFYRLSGRDEAQLAQLVGMFDRGAEYAALLRAIGAAEPGDAKALRGLRRDLSALVAIDYFPGEARRQAQEALAALESSASGEPAGGRARFAVLPAPTFRNGRGRRARISGSTAWRRPG